jgi:ABC-type Co2+ transport system permease subunit
MHIPDGFLNDTLAGGLLVGSISMLGYCLNKILKTVTVTLGSLTYNISGTNLGLQSLGFYENASKYFQH